MFLLRVYMARWGTRVFCSMGFNFSCHSCALYRQYRRSTSYSIIPCFCHVQCLRRFVCGDLYNIPWLLQVMPARRPHVRKPVVLFCDLRRPSDEIINISSQNGAEGVVTQMLPKSHISHVILNANVSEERFLDMKVSTEKTFPSNYLV